MTDDAPMEKPTTESAENEEATGVARSISTDGVDEYKLIGELYRYYTQLSFDIVKFYLTLNVALIGAIVLSSSNQPKGFTALLITSFALAMTATAMASFRKCIKHCAMLRDRAIKIEKPMGFAVFTEVKKLNLKTRGGLQAARTLAMVLAVIISGVWVAFLLHCWGITSFTFHIR